MKVRWIDEVLYEVCDRVLDTGSSTPVLGLEVAKAEVLMSHRLRYAKDYKCSCGKQAVVFVGLNDPDATEYPKCRKCADAWKIELLRRLEQLDREEEAQKKTKKAV
jgi:hypothetical protein